MNTNHSSDSGERISRREAMRRGLCGAGGVLLADRLGSDALAAAAEAEPKPRRRSRPSRSFRSSCGAACRTTTPGTRNRKRAASTWASSGT